MRGVGIMREPERAGVVDCIPTKGRVLEIGTWHGVDVAAWAAARPEAVFLSVDSFGVGTRSPIGNMSHWYWNARTNQSIFVGSMVRFTEIVKPKKKFDVVVVSGGALTIRDCLAALRLSSELLLKSGAMLVHGYRPVADAVQDFCAASKFDVQSVVESLVVLKR